MGGTQGLLEREAELETFAELAGLARHGRGGVLLVEGPAGIGKTRLIQAWLTHAKTHETESLSARGGRLERDFPFGVVRQLFELPLVSLPEVERADLLSGAASLAAPLLGNIQLNQGALPPNEASYATLHGLYWMTANLAARRPIVLAVDDVHWSDAPSLRFLVYLIKRIDELPILLVLAARPREPETEMELLEEIASSPLVHVLKPAPLSQAAVAELVRTEFSSAADDEFCAACRRATQGNPFLLRELLKVLAEDDAVSTAAQVARIPELGPSAIARSVLRRLERLPRGAPALARAVAILGDSTDLQIAAELVELDASEAAEAADALVRADIFCAGASLGFAHPIVRASIYRDLAPVDRARRHARAARMLARRGSDLDQVAMHLLAGEPSGDSQALETLRQAAGRAVARGAPEVAATYLRRALSEPPPPDLRARVLLELGSAGASAGEPDALRYLRQALETSNAPRECAEIALELARWLVMAANFHEATEVLDRALVELGDRELVERLEAELLTTSAMSLATLPRAVERIPRIREELRGETPDDPVLLAMLAIFTTTILGPAAAGVELAEEALKDPQRVSEQNWIVFAGPVFALAWAGRPDRAAQACDEALREARQRGSVATFANVSTLRSHVVYRRGSIPEAEADARRPSLEVAHLPEGAVPRPIAVAVLIDALLERGEVQAAETVLGESGIGGTLPEFILFNFLLDSRGRLRLAQGRVREGLEDLLECGRRVEAWGVRNPGMIPWRSNAALALLSLEEREEARRLAREEVELAREFGVVRELGMALRALGLIEGKERGIELLREAVAALEGSQAALEQARALTDLGGALRRRGQRADARAPLRRGLDLALRCGATALAERAHQELVATGARPRRVEVSGVGALTASERRVAEMAAEGPTNREIAQALFVTEKTVEWHLGQVYRKLGISSRSQLPAALSIGR